MKIGDLEIEAGVVLAPMAGFTDRAMRMVAAECGAEYVTTEMISAKAVVFGDKKTARLAKIEADEAPTAIQIFGSEPDIMARAAELLATAPTIDGVLCRAPSSIDINMGCPVHKIFANGEGSALMRNPELIYKITSEVRRAIDIPLGVKLRIGIDDSHINATECALAAESAGADFITMHGRTRAGMYGGECNLQELKKVKQSLHIPFIANGDVTDAISAKEMFSYVGCDAIMVGRAAIGNPFIFREIISALSGVDYMPPTLDMRRDMALRQLSLAVSDKGERVAVAEARKQIALYFRGYRGAAALRGRINTAESFLEVKRLIFDLDE